MNITDSNKTSNQNTASIEDVKPTESTENINSPPTYESLEIQETITAEIDFSINPYLVPYPEQEPKMNTDPITDSTPIIKSTNETLTINREEIETSQVSIAQSSPVLPNQLELSVTDSVTVEMKQQTSPSLPVVVATTPITSPTSEESSKTPSNNQQLESIKKSLEFFTNGCHNFFLFKSKNSNNHNENTNSTGKKKELKEKHSKSSNKMNKSNSKNTTSTTTVASTVANNENAIDNQSDKSEIFKGKIRNSDDEKEFAIKA